MTIPFSVKSHPSEGVAVEGHHFSQVKGLQWRDTTPPSAGIAGEGHYPSAGIAVEGHYPSGGIAVEGHYIPDRREGYGPDTQSRNIGSDMVPIRNPETQEATWSRYAIPKRRSYMVPTCNPKTDWFTAVSPKWYEKPAVCYA